MGRLPVRTALMPLPIRAAKALATFGYSAPPTERCHTTTTPAPIRVQPSTLRNGGSDLYPPVLLPRVRLTARPAPPNPSAKPPRTIAIRTHAAPDFDSDDGWGSDFDDDELTPAERRWCLERHDWEDRKMAGRIGEPPPPPPRAALK